MHSKYALIVTMAKSVVALELGYVEIETQKFSPGLFNE